MTRGGVYSAMIVGRPGATRSLRARVTPAKTNAPTRATLASACNQPQAEAKYDESKGTKVPGSKPIAIVMVWYGSTGPALAAIAPPADRIWHVSVEPW